jgi:hypothetical protein
VRRTYLIAAPGAALVLLLAGCGSSSASGAAAASSSAAAAKEAPLTAAEAHEIAVAAQLQAADLPGFTEDKSAAGDADAPDASDKELQACVTGSAEPNYLADVSSSDFSKGTLPAQLQASSNVQVVPTRQQGKAEFEALDKPETLACLNAALTKAFAAQVEGGTFEGQLERDPSTEDHGADEAARFALDGAFTVQGITVKMHVDLDQLLVDRAELTVSSVAIGEAPLPKAERDRLVRVVVDRARAAQKS